MKFLLLLFLGTALPVHGTTFDTQIEESSSQEGRFDQYRLWLPPNSHPDRILVVVWGSNQCSLGVVDDPVWQELAVSLNCALMAGFSYPQSSENHWDRASEGSGDALLKAIQTLAQTSGENQLANASLYLVGDSQGGQFAFSFASWQPNRTLGFVSLKGGHHDIADVENAARVPGLFFVGELDAPFRVSNVNDIFSKGRALGAPWCVAVDPHGDHSPAPCAPLVRSYLQALSKPLLEARGGAGDSPDKPDFSSSPNHISTRSWFPNAAFERDWSKFESQALEDLSPPLSFKSVMPPALGTAIPPSEDLGTIESGQKSQQFLLAVTPIGEANWDELSVLDCSYLSAERVVRSSPGHFGVYASLNTSDLPLGRFTEVIPLRFKSHGKPILGGANVPLTAKITGDLAAIPSLILLKAGPDNTESTQLKITSKKKLPITLLTYQAALGVKVESSSTDAGSLELTVSFNAFKASPSGLASGSLLLHLKTDKEWILRIPYIASSSP